MPYTDASLLIIFFKRSPGNSKSSKLLLWPYINMVRIFFCQCHGLAYACVMIFLVLSKSMDFGDSFSITFVLNQAGISFYLPISNFLSTSLFLCHFLLLFFFLLPIDIFRRKTGTLFSPHPPPPFTF